MTHRGTSRSSRRTLRSASMSCGNERDRWTATGRSILSLDRLQAIRRYLENGPLIVEHRYYYGSRCPSRQIFEEMEDFEHYLSQNSRPGDAFHVWDFSALCRDDN